MVERFNKLCDTPQDIRFEDGRSTIGWPELMGENGSEADTRVSGNETDREIDRESGTGTRETEEPPHPFVSSGTTKWWVGALTTLVLTQT